MKAILAYSILSSTVLFTSLAFADVVELRAHIVTADGVGLDDMAPGSPPSAAHREGTIFALLGRVPDASLAGRLVLVDVAAGRTLVQAGLACDALHEGADHEQSMYAVCGGSLVSFDARTLQVKWKVGLRGCAAQGAAVPSNIVTGGAGLIAVASRCGSVFVNVIDATTGSMLGATDTGLPADDWFRSSAEVFLHGTTVAVSSWILNGPSTLVVLSPRYDRVAQRQSLGFLQEAWDDGARLHIRQWPRGSGLYAEVAMTRPKGPAWLSAGRDYTVTDALAPIAWTRLGKEPEPTVYRPRTADIAAAGGDIFVGEMQMGAQHFWLTSPCCGGQEPGGVTTGRVEGR